MDKDLMRRLENLGHSDLISRFEVELSDEALIFDCGYSQLVTAVLDEGVDSNETKVYDEDKVGVI